MFWKGKGNQVIPITRSPKAEKKTHKEEGSSAAWDYPGEDRLEKILVMVSSGCKFRLILVGGPKAAWDLISQKVKPLGYSSILTLCF